MSFRPWGWPILLVEILKQESPGIVGITGTTPASESMKKAAANIRSCLQNTIIVVGGAHLNAMPVETMNSGLFDIGVLGEGEITFVELIRHIESNGLISIRLTALFSKEKMR